MNIKKLILNNKFLFTAPLIIGGIIGLVITQPKRTQSSDIASPVATAALNTNEVKSSETLNIDSSKQALDAYLVSAQSLLTKAITLSNSSEANDTANTQERNQQIVELINEAIETTNQAIAHYPASAPAYAQQAKIYQTITAYMPQAFETAVAYWQQAIRIDDKNPTYYTSLAELYLSQIYAKEKTANLVERDSQRLETDYFQSALYYLQKAVESDPTNPNQHKKLAEIQTQAGYINQAKITYQRLLSILSDENQIAKIQSEINSLNKLLAEAAAEGKTYQDADQGSSKTEEFSEKTILLPDSPPKLQASHLAGINTIIAEPKDTTDSAVSEVSKSNAKSGSATIPAGEKEIEICNNHLGPETQVYLVPESNENIILFVKSKSPYNPETGHCPNFVAATAKPIDRELEFRWWIIEK